MRKIMHFCDKCKDPVATQRVALGWSEEKHLIPMGSQEWCESCVDKHDIALRESPDINSTSYEHGEK